MIASSHVSLQLADGFVDDVSLRWGWKGRGRTHTEYWRGSVPYKNTVGPEWFKAIVGKSSNQPMFSFTLGWTSSLVSQPMLFPWQHSGWAIESALELAHLLLLFLELSWLAQGRWVEAKNVSKLVLFQFWCLPAFLWNGILDASIRWVPFNHFQFAVGTLAAPVGYEVL